MTENATVLRAAAAYEAAAPWKDKSQPMLAQMGLSSSNTTDCGAGVDSRRACASG